MSKAAICLVRAGVIPCRSDGRKTARRGRRTRRKNRTGSNIARVRGGGVWSSECGDELCEGAPFRDDGEGVGGSAEGGVGDRAGVDEGDGTVFRYFCHVGVSEIDQPAPQLLSAQGEGEKVGLDAVAMTVGEQDLHSFHLRHRLLREGEIVAVALDGEEALVQGEVARSRRAVAEEKDVVTLLRDGNEPRRESAFVDVGKSEYRFHVG